MAAINKIARWILLFASLIILVPSPESNPNKQLEWGDVPVFILAGMLALDMLYLILKLPRKRLHVLVEFGLYFIFIGLTAFRLITSNAISYLMSNELDAVGGRPLLLILFIIIFGTLIASTIVVLIDAKNALGKSALA